MTLIKPKKISKGDTIAIIAPSAGLANLFPHRLDKAINFLNSEGFSIKEFSTTRKNNGWESAPAQERAKDIMDAFTDKEIKMIICEIGGNTINKTLPYLDFKKIKENPKILVGYSDISVLHYAINSQSNLVTFYGPCIMTQFGEFPKPLNYTLESFNKAIRGRVIGKINPSEKWTDETLDWMQKEDLERPRRLVDNQGYTWLREGYAEGEIIGGCLHSIVHLIGTKYWPSHKGKILFIETPEGSEFNIGEPLPEVDAMLADLKLAGIF